jgi:4-O-beta-D-mannosyl-D-glucose phosphorylase
MTDLNDNTKVTHKTAGYFIAPDGEERVGDVSNVVFSNGWILDEDGRVLIYYASSDTRMHVAESSLGQLLDYVMNTAPDGLRSATTVHTLNGIIEQNKALVKRFATT